MDFDREVGRIGQRNALTFFAKRLAVAVVLLYFGIAAYGRFHRDRCTPSDAALSQAPAFAMPIDYSDAVAHPEKLKYVKAQARAVQRCAWTRRPADVEADRNG